MSVLLWHALQREERVHLDRTVAAEARLINQELVARMEPRVLSLARMAERWGRRLDPSTVDPAERQAWEMEAALNLSHFAGYEALLIVTADREVRWRVPPLPAGSRAISMAGSETALETSRERRTPRLTGPIDLPAGGRGFRTWVPVFDGETFTGWIGGTFRQPAVFDAILHDLAVGYEVEIEHAGELVYRQPAEGGATPRGPVARSRIALYGSPLAIRVRPGPPVLSATASPLPRVVLLSGLFLSILFGLALHFAQKADRRALTLATERRRLMLSEAELARSRDYYLILLERFPALIWRSNRNAWCDYHNQTWLDFTGRTFEEEQGSGWTESVHPDDLDLCMQKFMAAFNAREPFEMEYRLRHHSGEYRRVSDHARPIYDLEGRFAGYLGACFDLSQREKAVAALKESEAVFRTIFETSAVGIARTDPSGRFLFANEAYRQMVGCSQEELPALTVQAVTHPDEWPRNRELFEQLIRREIPSFQIEKRYRRKDGTEIWVHNSVSAVFDVAGLPLFVHAVSEDITEQKRIREELEKRELLLRDAQDLACMGSWEWDLGSDQVEWSNTEFRLFGLEPGSIDLTYASFLDLVHPEDQEAVKADVRRTMEAGESDSIFRIFQPDGSVRWLQARRRVVRDEAGKPARMIGTSHDITELKEVALENARLLEELRDSEEKYRLLADHSGDLITYQAPDGEILYVSPAVESMFGYTAEEVVGRNGREFIHPEDLSSIEAQRLALLHGEPTTSVTFRMKKKAGGYLWAETTTRAVPDPGSDRFKSLISVTRDITAPVIASQRARLLLAVTSIANEADRVGPALRLALERICEHTGWCYGHIVVADRKTGVSGAIEIWQLPAMVSLESFQAVLEEFPVLADRRLSLAVLAGGQAQWIEDLGAGDELSDGSREAPPRIRSAFAFPIRSGDRTLAVLEFFSPDIVPRDEPLIEILDEVGIQLGEMTWRLSAEASLAASELRFRALSESAHDAILTLDETGRILYCNESVVRVFGYESDELVGRPFSVLMSDDTPERRSEAAAFSQLMRARDRSIVGRTVELVGRRRDGSGMPVELALSWWEVEERAYFTVILRDITARKHAEAKLKENMAELARSNAELALFTYVASHDLREPLRTVASNVQLLERRLRAGLDPAARKEIEFAVEGVNRMQSLISDLLTYSRVGTEGKTFANVDTETVLAEAMQSLDVAIEEENGEIDHDPLPDVLGDRSQLVQLFQNLLSNAIKFRDSEPPRVHVSAAREGGEWVFSVRDNGIGIDPAYADHIFTIFQRLHTAEEYPGTGIGLAVCRRIVERHRGRIWVESEPGAGSTFRFTIPVPSESGSGS